MAAKPGDSNLSIAWAALPGSQRRRLVPLWTLLLFRIVRLPNPAFHSLLRKLTRRPSHPRFNWQFIATLPNSGSTALAMLLETSPASVALTDNAEAQWLIPELSAPVGRWRADTPLDHERIARVWRTAARNRVAAEGIASDPVLVIEKSPPNMVRMQVLLDTFAEEKPQVLVYTRNPFAICASWKKRMPPERIAEEWGEAAGPEETYANLLGRICGSRMKILAGLLPLARMKLSYEELTADPDATAAAIARKWPLLTGMRTGADISVKDYKPQSLKDMNGEQLRTLTDAEISDIAAGLAPYADSIQALGYSAASPTV